MLDLCGPVKASEDGHSMLQQHGFEPRASVYGKAADAGWSGLGRGRGPSEVSLAPGSKRQMAPAVMHPLTAKERLSLSAQIQQEVMTCALDLLQEEQNTEQRLNVVHVKCISLLVLASVAIGGCMIYLRVVLVPFVLALFFMFLLEPLFFALLKVPTCLRRPCPSLCHRPEQKTERLRGQATTGQPVQGAFGDTPRLDVQANCGDSAGSLLQHVLTKAWTSLSIVASMVFLMGICALVIFTSFKTVESFPWSKYVAGPNMKLVLTWFPEFGTDPEQIEVERVMPWLLQGPIFNALDVTFSIMTQGFLTMLFLAFLLSYDASFVCAAKGDLSQVIRNSVQRYIRIKSIMAFLVAFSTGFLYWLFKVDLFFLFALATFILYYIPHVGNTIAILAPLPLVFLDPTKSLIDLVILFTLPFVIHQMATNLIDPKLLADTLDLHPITVLLSLAFWTTMWGPVGAVLSVPLTAVVRLLLLEVKHPYTQPIVNILKGEIKDLNAAAESSTTPRRSRTSQFLSETSPSEELPSTEGCRRPSKACAREGFGRQHSPETDEGGGDARPPKPPPPEPEPREDGVAVAVPVLAEGRRGEEVEAVWI